MRKIFTHTGIAIGITRCNIMSLPVSYAGLILISVAMMVEMISSVPHIQSLLFIRLEQKSKVDATTPRIEVPPTNVGPYLVL